MTIEKDVARLCQQVAKLQARVAELEPKSEAAPEAVAEGLPVGQYRDGFGIVRNRADGSQVIDPDAGTDLERSIANARAIQAKDAADKAERLAQGGFKAPWGTIYESNGKPLGQTAREDAEALEAIRRRGGGNPARRELEEAGVIQPHARALED